MKDIQLKCACGSLQGVAHNVTPKMGNRIVCHCTDCQAFAQYLGREDILDEYKGTDIFQMSPALVEITKGGDQLRCMKLRPKGLFRWYADCCKTPVGNTMNAKVPFVGIIHNFMDDEGRRDENLGPILAHAFIKKDSDAGHLYTPMIKLVPRMFSRFLVWKVRDGKKSSPFFVDGKPVSEPVVGV